MPFDLEDSLISFDISSIRMGEIPVNGSSSRTNFDCVFNNTCSLFKNFLAVQVNQVKLQLFKEILYELVLGL